MKPTPPPARIVNNYPPAALTQDCPLPVYEKGKSWEALAEYAAAVLTVAIECDRCDKQRLRAWVAAKRDPTREAPPTPACRPGGRVTE